MDFLKNFNIDSLYSINILDEDSPVVLIFYEFLATQLTGSNWGVLLICVVGALVFLLNFGDGQWRLYFDCSLNSAVRW